MHRDELLEGLATLGIRYHPELVESWYDDICNAGFRGMESHTSVAVLCGLAYDNQPLTVRSLMYRGASVGLFPSTDGKWYNKTVRLAGRMRKTDLIPYSWIVDNLRSTQKPSSWAGLEAFADTVRNAYRKDFWSSLPNYCHVLCEKDAIAGTIAPVTQEYDVPLSPIRGYISDSFAYELGNQWRQINKPIVVYYVGDFDPSGFDLERNARDKLEEFAGKKLKWKRLGVNFDDFERFNLVKLKAKKTDSRWRRFVKQHGGACAEIDALPPPDLRKRLRTAIESIIPSQRWETLKRVELAEKETFNTLLDMLPATNGSPPVDDENDFCF